MVSTSSQWVVVTGGNRGIGYDVCRKLVRSGRSVLLCSRNIQAGRDAASKLGVECGDPDRCVALALDAADVASVSRFAADVARNYDQQIYALINNAAVYPYGWTEEVFESTMQVNFRAPVELAERLAPHIISGGRIVNVTSGLGSLHNLSAAYQRRVASANSLEALRRMPFDPSDDFGFKPSYCLTKAMINRAGQLMSQLPDFHHLSINAADPGWCRTEMGGSSAPRSLDQGSASLLATLELPVEANGGVYMDGKRRSL